MTEQSKSDDSAITDEHDQRGAGTAGLPQVVDALELLPGVGQALQYLASMIPAVSLERARQTIDAVLNLIDRDDDWLLTELHRRPNLGHFIAQACRTWATDSDEAFRSKRAAYRAIIRRGLIDDAAIDHELLRLDAIGELSPLDLRVLQIIEYEIAGTNHPVAKGPTVVDRLDGDIASAQVVLGHLERLMVIQSAGRTWGEVEGVAESGVPSTMRLTVFGQAVMADLHSGE